MTISIVLNCVAKDCLTGMLQRNPAHRLTADEVLNSDWIQARASKCLTFSVIVC